MTRSGRHGPEPFALTAEALHEPWCLWTCHLTHLWEALLGLIAALPGFLDLRSPAVRRA
jgi:hypothetical protein